MLVDRPQEGDPNLAKCPNPSLEQPTFAAQELQPVMFASANPSGVTLESLLQQCSYGGCGGTRGGAA